MDLLNRMYESLNHHFPGRPLDEPEVKVPWTSEQIRELRDQYRQQRVEEITSAGIDALINHDFIEDHQLARFYADKDWIAFGVRIEQLIQREAAHDASEQSIDDSEIWSEFYE